MRNADQHQTLWLVYKHLNGNKKVCYLQFQNNIIIFSIKKVFNLDDTRLKGGKEKKQLRSSPRGEVQEQNLGHPAKVSRRPRPGIWSLPQDSLQFMQGRSVRVCSAASVESDSMQPMDYSLSGSSVEFFRQEYWRELPFPVPDLPSPGIKPKSLAPPALAHGFFPTVPPTKPGSHQFSILYVASIVYKIIQPNIELSLTYLVKKKSVSVFSF